MPLLHLLRHAKSSSDRDEPDPARRLSRGGRDAARQVGRHLAASLDGLDLVLCSTARRTRETLELVLAELGPPPPTRTEEALYLASPETLLRLLRQLGAETERVLVIGHNPGLHELALALADPASPDFAALASGSFPTAARASFRLEAPWPEIGSAAVPLIAYVTPKSLGGGA